MEQTLTSITDAQLIGSINSSRLRDDQKARLSQLVGKMNEADRNELMGIIAKANHAGEEADKRQAVTDAKFDKKLKTIVHEKSEQARKAFEEIEQRGAQATVQNLESEIEQSQEPSRLEGLESQENIAPRNHNVKLKIAAAFAILFTMAGGIVYILSML